MENNYLLIKIKIIIYKMNKPFISFLLILSLFSSNFSKKLTIFAEEEIISTSFEDGDISMFTPRGEYDASTLTLKKDGGNKGSNYLWISDRKETWNGAQFSLEGKCKEGEQYKATVAVKASSGNICLSMQHTDSSGEDHYNNLQCTESHGSWTQMKEFKFTIPSGAKTVYLYFENTSGNDDFGIDDFEIKLDSSSIDQDIKSLKDVYKSYFKFGTATTVDELAPKTTQDLILKHFNSLTIGNELKPDYLLDKSATLQNAQSTGDYTNPLVKIGGAAQILDFCAKNNIPVRGHVLVWHSQTPSWFFKERFDDNGNYVDKDTMLKRMENYIKNVFEMMKKDYSNVNFYAWDVVNEAWEDDGSPRKPGEGNGNSPWVKIFGDNSFIKYAFQYAKKYGIEGCKLFYNDYNEYIEGKTNAIIKMVNEINSGEKLIDGIGMQSHLDVQFPGLSMYESAVKAFSQTGLDIQVTELDATTECSSNGFQTQAQYYSDILDVLVKYSRYVSAVVVWGTTDDKSWRSSQCPLLFNGDYSPKSCFNSIIDGL